MSIANQLEACSTPVVLKDLIKDWPALEKWTLDYLAGTLEGPVHFRMGRKSIQDRIQWEVDCQHVQATLNQLGEWLAGSGEEHPFSQYPCREWWAYADYQYVRDLFTACPQLVADLGWEKLGFPEGSGWASTFWLGAGGPYTACHYDTYGTNLVAQIRGRKRWILFPPSDSAHLYPTRLPYEESTVFSGVNLVAPDTDRHPLFLSARPYLVTLEPGHLLYVPRHWWHFVQCADSSPESKVNVSVNLWLDSPARDNEERLGEALTQLAMNCFAEAHSSWRGDGDGGGLGDRFHRGERNVFSTGSWFDQGIRDIGHYCCTAVGAEKATDDDEDGEIPRKASRTWTTCQLTTMHQVKPNKVTEVFNLTEEQAGTTSETVQAPVSFETVVQAFTHPSVIEQVKNVLKSQLISSSPH